MDDHRIDNELKLQTGKTSMSPTQDELILQQHRRIEKEISDTIKLIGEKESLKCLEDEYKNDEVYCKKVKTLLSKYNQMRRTRPDGNCFFRAFGYGYFEQLMNDSNKLFNFENFALTSKERLVSLGFPPFTLEDFHDIFMEVVDVVRRGPGHEDDLYKIFNEPGYSDYVVVYLRLLTSAHLQENSDFYIPFIDGNRSVVDFCRQEVEPMYKESDHIHITALTSALQAYVRVVYLDRGAGVPAIHDFPPGLPPEETPVNLLYRPGHYDLLYPSEVNDV